MRQLHSPTYKRRGVRSTPRSLAGIDGIKRPASLNALPQDIQPKNDLPAPQLLNNVDTQEDAAPKHTKKDKTALGMYAAGLLTATGLIAFGAYIGLLYAPNKSAEATKVIHSVPSTVDEADADTEPISPEAENPAEDAKEVVYTDVVVDESIDIKDVDVTPPTPKLPDQPDRIIIPKLDVDADVASLRHSESGALAVPRFTNQVGWYDLSSKPGQSGTSVMDGHFGLNGDAVFGNLHELEVGELVEVKLVNGDTVRYSVVAKDTYSAGEVPMNKLIESDGSQKLNLITCSGSWDADISTFDSRTIVYTELVT